MPIYSTHLKSIIGRFSYVSWCFLCQKWHLVYHLSQWIIRHTALTSLRGKAYNRLMCCIDHNWPSRCMTQRMISTIYPFTFVLWTKRIKRIKKMSFLINSHTKIVWKQWVRIQKLDNVWKEEWIDLKTNPNHYCFP